MKEKTKESDKIIRKLEEKKQNIRKYGVKKIGVFGSFVKDKQHKKSDIDILVTFENISFDSYLNILTFLEKMFKRKIDLVIEDDLKPELKYVKKEAEYAKI